MDLNAARAQLASLALILAFSAVGHAQAQDAAEFYRDRTVTILVGSGPGGTTDTTARIITRFLGRHIPGAPDVIAVNMPGGGSTTMTNHVYRSAARDGLVLGYSLPGVVTAQLLEPDRAKFDAGQFNWIGSALGYTGIVSVLDSAPATSVDAARETEVFIGTTGRGSPAYQYPAIAQALLGLRFQLVTGYSSSNEVVLAMERGEVHGQSSSLQYWAITRPEWLANGRIVHLLYVGPPDPLALAGVPYLRDLVATPAERAIVDFVATGSYLGWPLFAPPEVPADRVAALRLAFASLMSDAEFGDAFEITVGSQPRPTSGNELTRRVEAALATPPDVIRKTRRILDIGEAAATTD